MRKHLKWTLAGVSVVFVVGTSVTWTLCRAARHEPEFYQQALLVEPEQQADVGDEAAAVDEHDAGDEFEQEVLELRNNTQEFGGWYAEFTADELNGWLASDLPQKFPTALPAGVESPRVAIEDGLLRVAARYRGKSISSVLSFALQIHLTDEPNMLAVRILEVRAGALPIPISHWLEKVRTAIQRTDLVVRWSQSEGDPVALVAFPEKPAEQSEQKVKLETIAIEPGVLRVSGSTTAPPGFPIPARHSPSPIVHQSLLDDASENRITHR
jgi:hypothetical protein